MAIGKLEEKTEEDIVAEINITPLTDIFLVLLIIFMITSSALIESGANIKLPKVAKTETVSRNVVITLTKAGELFINQKKISKNSFEDDLKKALAESNTKVVILEGDKDALLGEAVKLISQAKDAGAKEIAIAAEQSKTH